MMKVLVTLIFLFGLSACNSPRQAAQTLPPTVVRDTIIHIQRDTIVKEFPSFVFDTTASIDISIDSFSWENDLVKTVMVLKKDTFWRYQVKTEIKSDTLFLTHRDTIFQEKIKEVIIEGEEKGAKAQWWIVAILAGIAALYGYQIKKVNDNTK